MPGAVLGTSNMQVRKIRQIVPSFLSHRVSQLLAHRLVVSTPSCFHPLTRPSHPQGPGLATSKTKSKRLPHKMCLIPSQSLFTLSLSLTLSCCIRE